MREISGLIFLRVRFKRLPEGESGLFELALVFLMMLMLFAPLYGWKNPERGLPARAPAFCGGSTIRGRAPEFNGGLFYNGARSFNCLRRARIIKAHPAPRPSAGVGAGRYYFKAGA